MSQRAVGGPCFPYPLDVANIAVERQAEGFDDVPLRANVGLTS